MAENELSLKDRLEDTMFDALTDLQEIAEEMFVRFYTASGTAAQERAQNLTLMQEIQRLEEENGRLRTELDKAEERCRVAARETESAMKLVEGYQANNRALDARNTELEMQMRRMVSEEAKEERIATAPAEPAAEQRKIQRQTSPEDARPRNDSGIAVAVKCQKCGSMDVATNCFGRKGLCACNVCAEVFEVEDNG